MNVMDCSGMLVHNAHDLHLLVAIVHHLSLQTTGALLERVSVKGLRSPRRRLLFGHPALSIRFDDGRPFERISGGLRTASAGSLFSLSELFFIAEVSNKHT